MIFSPNKKLSTMHFNKWCGLTKIYYLLIFGIYSFTISRAQTISISSARSMAPGNVVTVSGIVTNGFELGAIRYIQDGTAGISVYDAQLNGVNRGDVITVTGTLTDYFNLLEINPVTAFTVNSSGNPLPSSV